MQFITKDTQKEMNLSSDVFEYDYNEGLIHQLVVTFMNNARSGNSAQKTRSEVRGGGKKPWNQKGSGRARAGTIRSPIWRSGGVTFASKKRDYSQKINKKMYKRAMRSIISELARLGRLSVVSDFQCASNKTKDFVAKMKELELGNALIIMHEVGEAEYFEICDVHGVDPIVLLSYEHVLMTEAAIRNLEECLA